MPRESNIPLFLWIATAVLAHLAWGGGATRVSRMIEETLDIQRFARSVQLSVQAATGSTEVTLIEDKPSEPKDDPTPKADAPEDPTDPADDPEEIALPEKEKEKKKEPEPEKPKPEPEKPKPEVAKKAEAAEAKTPPELPKMDPKKRIAVVQHVDDPNQKDNPNAEFIGDQANHVKKQTQARITSTDQNDKNPTPGGNHTGPTNDPGDSDEARVAQSDDHEGEKDRAPDPAPPADVGKAAQEPAQAAGAPKPAPKPAATRPEPAQSEKVASKGSEARPDTLAGESGAYSVSSPREARREVKAQKKRRKKKRLPPAKYQDDRLLGFGAMGTTKNGIRLSLSPRAAVKAIGQDRLAMERKLDGERRRSKHRGSWKSQGIERWRSAIENYVPSVQPGNQTALNTARVPFASYLNAIHNRLHPIFADSFLASLDSLPANHPMNRPDIKTHLEIVLSQDDGRVVRMGVTRTSGVTAFDIAALESVQRGSPYGAPPREIVSPDGNVYFHWEFYRNPYYACSTYFARPYILKVKPKTAPPEVNPPKEPYDPKEGPPPSDQRHGKAQRPALEKHAALR
ncbi:MAG: hypothetical protein KC776_11770 [Myxococcales bacterium]|nr:hypothetical protein [Myxococcales bacterium]MCB9582990.1 hypothetical protein [Polyangiaceae bacterium]